MDAQNGERASLRSPRPFAIARQTRAFFSLKFGLSPRSFAMATQTLLVSQH